jgi:hypothetical protein
MGITFRHDAAAGLIGAYAAGQAENKRRNQRYANEMLLRGSRYAPRMRVPRVAGGLRGQAAAAPQGQWVDPVEENFLLTDEEKRERRVQQRAQGKAYARKSRLGKAPVRGDLMPYFESQDVIDQRNEAEAARVQRQQELEDARRQREMQLEDERRNRQQAKEDTDLEWMRDNINTLAPEAPDNIANNPNLKPQWDKLNRDVHNVLKDSNMSREDRDIALQEIQQERQDLISNAPPMKSDVDAFNENQRWQGPDGKVYAERGEGPGWTPGQIIKHEDGRREFLRDPNWQGDQDTSDEDVFKIADSLVGKDVPGSDGDKQYTMETAIQEAEKRLAARREYSRKKARDQRIRQMPSVQFSGAYDSPDQPPADGGTTPMEGYGDAGSVMPPVQVQGGSEVVGQEQPLPAVPGELSQAPIVGDRTAMPSGGTLPAGPPVDPETNRPAGPPVDSQTNIPTKPTPATTAPQQPAADQAMPPTVQIAKKFITQMREQYPDGNIPPEHAAMFNNAVATYQNYLNGK